MDCFLFNAENVTYFDSFGVEHILQKNEKFIGNKNIATNNYRIQAYDSIMHEYFCIEFVDLMLKRKSLLQIYFLLMITERMIILY